VADATSAGPVYFRPSLASWVDDRAAGSVPPSMLDAAERLGGGGRKVLARGEGGFHSTYSEVPPGYHMVAHRHDVDELFIVLGGSCEWSDGQELSAGDSAVITAGCVHGYTVGPGGLRILTVTTSPFSTTLVGQEDDAAPPDGRARG
jgi:quercetin dioxygenase-like cupin family protein